MIYICACRYFNPSSEVKLKFICEHKALLQLIRSVYNSLILFQALSKQLTGTEFISCFSVQCSQVNFSFDFFNRNWVEIEPWDQSILFPFLLNEWWFILLLNTLSIICYLFKPCFRFWINSVHEIRKYKFNEIACSDVLFVVHRYLYKFVGIGGGLESNRRHCVLIFLVITCSN